MDISDVYIKYGYDPFGFELGQLNRSQAAEALRALGATHDEIEIVRERLRGHVTCLCGKTVDFCEKWDIIDNLTNSPAIGWVHCFKCRKYAMSILCISSADVVFGFLSDSNRDEIRRRLNAIQKFVVFATSKSDVVSILNNPLFPQNEWEIVDISDIIDRHYNMGI